MSKYNKIKQTDSPETIASAKKIAQKVRKPAQNKAQLKLLEQGIQKGITLYKKQQKEKHRKADKLHKQQQKQKNPSPQIIETPSCSKLPWILLSLTWFGIALACTYFVWIDL